MNHAVHEEGPLQKYVQELLPIHPPLPKRLPSPIFLGQSPFLTTSKFYPLDASNASLNPTTLKLGLLPIEFFVLIFLPSHFLNTIFISLGAPSRTTVLTGTKGRSSSDAARIPYSCAKRRAVWNSEGLVLACAPTRLVNQIRSVLFYGFLWMCSVTEKRERVKAYM